MGKRIYASIPVNYCDRVGLIDDIKIDLIALNGEVMTPNKVTFSVWREGDRYSDNLVRDADIFIFTHTDNRFDFPISSLPIGVSKELNLAIATNKKIFLIYRNRQEQIGYYEINHDDLGNGTVRGKPGYSRSLHDFVMKKAGQVTYKEEPVKMYDEVYKVPNLRTFDKRLLLTIK